MSRRHLTTFVANVPTNDGLDEILERSIRFRDACKQVHMARTGNDDCLLHNDYLLPDDDRDLVDIFA